MRQATKLVADRVTLGGASAMACVKCGETTVAVLDSRMTGNDMKRRRGCLTCDHRWTTYEISADRLRVLESRNDIRGIGERAVRETG